jgi:hypothetical protein
MPDIRLDRFQWGAGEITVFSSRCDNCLHRIEGTLTCKAFPNKIPIEIYQNKHHHSNPYPGDNGILYKPKTGIGSHEEV